MGAIDAMHERHSGDYAIVDLLFVMTSLHRPLIDYCLKIVFLFLVMESASITTLCSELADDNFSMSSMRKGCHVFLQPTV